jgi:tetratricopeptide (TPR) repeat protein
VELDPDDQVALTHLGHTALAAGRSEEGVGYLAKAADLAHAGAGTSTAAISLVDMYRSFGQYEQALAQARRLADAVPDDVLARLDVAEMATAAGQLDEARSSFERLRELDDVPGHEPYPLYGLIGVEIAAGDWGRARELTEQAAALEPYGMSGDVAAFVRERAGLDDPEELDHPVPSRPEVDEVLAASLAEYRRMLVDDRPLTAGEPVG